MVSHGHIIVNGRKTNIPSMVLKAGDSLQVREGSKKNGLFKEMAELAEKNNCALWLERDLKTLGAVY